MGGVAEEKKKKKPSDPGALSALKGRVCVCVSDGVFEALFFSLHRLTTYSGHDTNNNSNNNNQKKKKKV
jgi:hypothetical protein